jgi:hypothetical protein
MPYETTASGLIQSLKLPTSLVAYIIGSILCQEPSLVKIFYGTAPTLRLVL